MKRRLLPISGQMIDGDDSADDGGELQQLCGHLVHVGVGEGDVRGGEGYLVLVKLLDAGLGADAVVADLNVGVMLAEGLDPYLVERCGEGSARGLKDSDRAFRGRAGEGDEKLSGDLVGEIVTDAGGYVSAGRDDIGPEKIAAFADKFCGEEAAVDREVTG